MYDFHTHSLLSDGVLLPVELFQRAKVAGLKGIALTDHAGPGNLEQVITATLTDCQAFSTAGFLALPGVELTHLPPALFSDGVKKAIKLGAKLIIGHGESPVEPVAPGTNRAAIEAGVDILAHPGLIDEDTARLAASEGVFLELSARQGHSLANGHVAAVALRTGASLLIGSDMHQPGELLDIEKARTVALGAGVPESLLSAILFDNPLKLLAKIKIKT